MIKSIHKGIVVAVAGVAVCSVLPVAEQVAQGEAAKVQPDTRSLQAKAHDVLETYCISCHGPEQQKGDVRFDALETIDTVDQQTLFLSAQDAVHFEEMPPKKAKQPSAEDRAVLLAWLKDQLSGEAAGKLAEKMRRPEAGNYVNHEDLFSGEYADLPGYTEDRRWLISEHIFNEKFNRILMRSGMRDIDGKRHKVQGHSGLGVVNLTNPFLLPNHAGVRYYANETLNGGHLLTMLANAKDTASYIMTDQVPRNSRYLPAASEIMSFEMQNKRVLDMRGQFLSLHIERVLQDTFADKHQEMLPKFVRVEVPGPIAEGGAVKKAPFQSAIPGQEELVLIFRAMRRLVVLFRHGCI